MADVEELPPEGEEQERTDAPENEEKPELTEIEQLAAEMGWNPDFEGEGKVDARTYMRETRDINRSLKKSLRSMERQMEGIGRATAAMTQRELDRQRAELEAAHDRAVEKGDTQAARDAAKAMRELPQDAVEEGPSAEGQDFIEKHSAWFGKNQEATQFSVERVNHYAEQKLSPARQIAAMEKDMRAHFPELFEEAEPAPKPHQPQLGKPQRSVSTAPREKGYATLPPAARKACDDWARMQKDNNGWDDKRVTAAKSNWATHYYEQEAANG